MYMWIVSGESEFPALFPVVAEHLLCVGAEFYVPPLVTFFSGCFSMHNMDF